MTTRTCLNVVQCCSTNRNKCQTNGVMSDQIRSLKKTIWTRMRKTKDAVECLINKPKDNSRTTVSRIKGMSEDTSLAINIFRQRAL